MKPRPEAAGDASGAPADERPPGKLWRLSQASEEILVAVALLAMVLLPVLEMLARTGAIPRVPGSFPIVQHLTLWVAFLGAAIAARNQIPFVALEPHFREATRAGSVLHWRYDGHWNPAGNDLAGRLLAGFIVWLA